VQSRPLFLIFRPRELPDPQRTLAFWRELAVRAGLPPLYIVCQHHDPAFDPHRLGFDASMIVKWSPINNWRKPAHKLRSLVSEKLGRPNVSAYDAAVRNSVTRRSRVFAAIRA
jgi:hypothetical protein